MDSIGRAVMAVPACVALTVSRSMRVDSAPFPYYPGLSSLVSFCSSSREFSRALRACTRNRIAPSCCCSSSSLWRYQPQSATSPMKNNSHADPYSSHRSALPCPKPYLPTTDGPVAPNIMYAMTRTATIALPMSNILFLSTATSLNSVARTLATPREISGACPPASSLR